MCLGRRYRVFLVGIGWEKFLRETVAVSPKEACNNVRWRVFGRVPADELGGQLEARESGAIKTSGPQLWLPGIVRPDPLSCFRR